MASLPSYCHRLAKGYDLMRDYTRAFYMPHKSQCTTFGGNAGEIRPTNQSVNGSNVLNVWRMCPYSQLLVPSVNTGICVQNDTLSLYDVTLALGVLSTAPGAGVCASRVNKKALYGRLVLGCSVGVFADADKMNGHVYVNA